MADPVEIARISGRVVEAMREDPFIDDAYLLGTSQQESRMEHYATIAVRAVIEYEAIDSPVK